MTSYPQINTPIDILVFETPDPKEEWHHTILQAAHELKRVEGVCHFILSGGKKPTMSDLSLILNTALKFQSGDGYYAALEGSDTIDAGYVGALVYDVIDKHFTITDIAEMLFGGNTFLKEEFVNLKKRSCVSTSGCIRFIVPH